jgi:hypothetical protein
MFHHELFISVYLTVGLAIRVVVARRFATTTGRKIGLFAFVGSSVSSISLIWFPIVPLVLGIVLFSAGGNAVAQSLPISMPIIAMSMASKLL